MHRAALQVVAKLVHLKDPATALALEVTAGGRLYQVVVDSDATAKSLLQKGGLQKRVTIIPLNQVRRLRLPPMALRMGSGSRSRWCTVSFLQKVDSLLVWCGLPPVVYSERWQDAEGTAVPPPVVDVWHSEQSPVVSPGCLCCTQIRYSDLPQGVLGAARQLGGNKAQPALELVGYEGEVEAAVKYVFGNTFVCKVSGGCMAAVPCRS